MNGKRTSITKEEFLAAIPHRKGVLLPIEQELNCTRKVLEKMLKEYPEIREEFDAEKERVKDRIIIASVDDAIAGGDKVRGKARELLLRALARDRGFGEHVEVTGANGAPLVCLHTVAKLPTAVEWNAKATAYAEEEDKMIDAEIEKILPSAGGK